MIVPQEGPLCIQLMDDSRRRYALEVDAGSGKVVLSRIQDPTRKATLSYQEPEPGLLALEGTLDGRKVRARFRRADESRFQLVRHGFHWVHEPSFDR